MLKSGKEEAISLLESVSSDDQFINEFASILLENIKNDSLKNFEYETHLKIVGNVPNLNERLDSNSELNDLVKFLVGNIKVKSSHGGLFSFLRRKK